MDSSEEELGSEDIDGNEVGGVVELEDRIMSGNCGTEDTRVVAVEDFRTGGELNIFSIAGETHMQFIFDTIVDVRRMCDSLKQYSLPLLSSQIADKLCDRSDHFLDRRNPS